MNRARISNHISETELLLHFKNFISYFPRRPFEDGRVGAVIDVCLRHGAAMHFAAQE